MIKGFEIYTQPLNEEEMKVVHFLVNFFKGSGNLPRPIKEKPIPAPKLVNLINRSLELKTKFSEVRLRKCINFIRCNSMCFVCSSGKGYWEANTIQEMEDVIQSMEERANSILASAEGLRKLHEDKIRKVIVRSQENIQKNPGALF